MGEHDLPLKIANLIAYLVVFGVNAFLFTECFKNNDGNDDSDNLKPLTNDTDERPVPDTYLTPPMYAESIWFLIYILLAGFVTYQWFPAANDAVVEAVGWDNVISSVLNVSFSLVLVYADFPIANAIIAVVLLVVLSKVYHNLEYYPPKNIFDRIFIHWPFVIYTAWITMQTVNSLWLAIPFLDTVLFSSIVVIVYGLIGLHFVDYYHRKDVVFSATIVWGLIGLAWKNSDEGPIMIPALIGSGLIIGGIVRVWVHQAAAWWRLRNQRMGERDPLLRT